MLAPKKRQTFAVGAVALLAVVMGVSGCAGETNPWPEGKGPRVLVSFPPLYSFVKNVAGDDVTLLCLLSSEGPHHYQYHARDVLLLRQADLFLTNGLALDDHFTHKMKNSCGNPKLRFVELAARIDPSRLVEVKEGGHVCDLHPAGSKDPHVWLGIPEAVVMVEGICKELCDRDPANSERYTKRAAIYIKKLNDLHADGRKKLANKGVKLVTQHESLAYFARAFDVDLIGSIQVQPGDDPTSGRIVDLANLCKEKRAHIIAVEPQYPESTARALLGVLNQKLKGENMPEPVLVVIDPLETADPKELEDAGWYERKMAANIDSLAQAVK